MNCCLLSSFIDLHAYSNKYNLEPSSGILQGEEASRDTTLQEKLPPPLLQKADRSECCEI